MRNIPSALIVIGLWLASPIPTLAATPDAPRDTLHVVLHAQPPEYYLDSWGKDPKHKTLENPLPLVILPDEKVYIYIDDPDPFSNVYSWVIGSNSTSTNAATAQGFADKLLPIINGLEPSASGSAELNPLTNKRSALYGRTMLASYHQSTAPLTVDQQSNPSTPSEYSGRSSMEILTQAAAQLQSATATASDTYAQGIIYKAVVQVQQNPTLRAGQGKVQKVLADIGIQDSEAFLKGFKAALSTLYLYSARAEGLKADVKKGQGDAAKQAALLLDPASIESVLISDYRLMHQAGEALQSKLGIKGDITNSTLLQGIDFNQNLPDSKGAKSKVDELKLEKDAEIELLAHEYQILTHCLPKTETKTEVIITPTPDCIKLLELKNPSPEQVAEKVADKLPTVGIKLKQARADSAILDGLSHRMEDLEVLERQLARDPFFLSLIFILPGERDTLDTLQFLHNFKDVMQKVNVPIKVGEIDFADASSVRNATLRIEPIQPPGSVQLVKTDPLPEAKEYKFAFRPYSAFQLGVGGAAVFSFAKTHKYQVTPVSGGFQIKDAQTTDYTGASVAAMLTIVPNKWAQSDFHPLFEIGVGPQSSIALYSGFGAQFGKIFSFGAGIVFEQVDELAPGLSLGQVLANSGDLKTRKQFVGGLYLHFTATATVSGGKNN